PFNEATLTAFTDIAGGRVFEPFFSVGSVSSYITGATGPESGIRIKVSGSFGATLSAESETALTSALAASGEFTIETWTSASNLVFFSTERMSLKRDGGRILCVSWFDSEVYAESFFATYVLIPEHMMSGMHHWVFVFDGENAKFYADGHLLRSVEAPAPVWDDIGDFSTSITIGASVAGGGTVSLDDLAVYDRALPESEVQAHCAERATVYDPPSDPIDAYHESVQNSYPLCYVPAITGQVPQDIEGACSIDFDAAPKVVGRTFLFQEFNVIVQPGQTMWEHGYRSYEMAIFGEHVVEFGHTFMSNLSGFGLRWYAFGTTPPSVNIKYLPSSGSEIDVLGSWADDAWHHVVVNLVLREHPSSTNGLWLYVDGDEVLALDLSSGTIPPYNPLTQWPQFRGTPRFFDRAAVYSHILTEEEITERAAMMANLPVPFGADGDRLPSVGRLLI
ncbi:MAG TPA: LamG-like jellyroll fold domain-containing protein, partial [Nitrospira sp.]|nr:LamG-like jellyroll fold domain-containing protein [Nitrospira sp.]